MVQSTRTLTHKAGGELVTAGPAAFDDTTEIISGYLAPIRFA